MTYPSPALTLIPGDVRTLERTSGATLIVAILAAALMACALTATAQAGHEIGGAPDTSFGSAPPPASTDRTPQFTVVSSLGGPGTSFVCSLNSEPVDCPSPTGTSNSTAVELGPLDDGSYTFVATACHWDYNGGEPIERCDGTPASATFAVDNVGPNAGITSPSEGARINTWSFGLTGEEGGGYQCSLDGSGFVVCNGGVLPSALGPHLDQGSNTLTVKAFDAAGNTGATASRTFIWDTVSPVISSISPTITNDSTPTISITAPHDGGAPYVYWCYPAIMIGWDYCNPSNPYVPSWTSPWPLPDGTYAIQITAQDGLWNLDPLYDVRAPFTFTVDTVAPTIAFATGAPEGTVDDPTPTFGFTSSDSSGTEYSCRLDSAAAAPCSNPYTAPSLSEGSHTLEVTGRDAAGNASSALTRTFVVDLPSSDTQTPPGGDNQSVVPDDSVRPGTDSGPGRVTSEVKASFRARARFTLVRGFSVAPAVAGQQIDVSCRGRGCPAKKTHRVTGAASSVNLAKAFRRRRLRPGATIEVRILQSGLIGKVVIFTVRKKRQPRRQDLCMPPGASKPAAC